MFLFHCSTESNLQSREPLQNQDVVSRRNDSTGEDLQPSQMVINKCQRQVVSPSLMGSSSPCHPNREHVFKQNVKCTLSH